MSLELQAAAIKEQRRRARERAEISLLNFIPKTSPKFAAPHHLMPMLDLIERSQTEPIRVVVSTPPRHGKTETLLHAIAWLLLRDPSKQIAYAGYAQRFAEKKSAKARELARRSGVLMSGNSASRADWRTGVDDGGLWATSIGGPITGEGFNMLIVDDPVKDRATAESSVHREHVWEWFNDVAFTRIEPNGSCIVNMTRWHPDDLAGRLIDQGWNFLCLPALDNDDQPLWPERWSLADLLTIKNQLGAYGWESLYQGSPRPRSGRVFGDVCFYDTLPNEYKVSVGVDLAYTAKTHADYSVAVVLAHHADKSYVLEVVREQVRPEDFATRLQHVKAKYPGANFHMYASTTERGSTALLRSLGGVPIEGHLAGADKFIRAQPLAAAWNAGRVFVPKKADWLGPFIDELCGFTGIKDRHDDMVDASAAAYDALTMWAAPTFAGIAGSKPYVIPSRRM